MTVETLTTTKETATVHLLLVMIATQAIPLTNDQKNPATAVEIIMKENRKKKEEKVTFTYETEICKCI